ncbi:MAG TPA: transposase, partial [Chloroflexi bacterium]|nr:transposase [Chloroflexota bacterium]
GWVAFSRCPHCGTLAYKYHSCRNRHCPQCQHLQTQAWLDNQAHLLLPTHYFLLTFTLPAGLRALAQANQILAYNLLFRITAEAAQTLARDPRYVGG